MALFTFSSSHKKRLVDLTPPRKLPRKVLEWLKDYEENMQTAWGEYLERAYDEMLEEEMRREGYKCEVCGKLMWKEDALFCQFCEAPLCEDCGPSFVCPECAEKHGEEHDKYWGLET